MIVTSRMGRKPVVLNAKRPWPSTLSSPKNVQAELTRILNAKAGDQMTKKMRRVLLTSIFDHFSQYTL